MHTSIKINGNVADRLSTGFVNNPFASHYNSKLYSRYIGTRVPKEWIKSTDNFITVTIDMTS